MILNILPGDSLKHVVGYLLPRDVFNLSMSFPDDVEKYRPLLIGSLRDNLGRLMRSGRARFKSSDPLQSFIGMTAHSPRGSIVLSGSLIVQAILGKSWPGSDIDIFVHESEAPKIRKWLLYEDQVFAGCSAGYGNATNCDVFDYNVSHVEYYTNRDDSKYSYADAMDRGRRFKRHHILPLSGYVEVCTSDGEPMPFQSFLDLGAKKDIVNIDLIVVRSGRSVYDALDVFDLNICKSRFDGREWVIPQPLQTFKGCTELTGIVDNIIAKTYLAGIITESQRDIVSIVNEMDLYRFKRRYGAGDSSGVKSLVDKLVSVGNVFSCTIQPIVARSLSPHVHFVCLVTDVRNHLIRNALERVREIGLLELQSREVVLGINEWLSSSDRPLFLHNSIVRMWFKRFDKYLKRGVFIKDLLPDNCSRQASSDMLRFLPSFSEVVRGVTWPGEDQAIGDWSDVAPSAIMTTGVSSVSEAALIDRTDRQ